MHSDITLLDIQNLSIDFQIEKNTTHAIQTISFALHAGKTLALVGESGSGKSVTALSILKLLSTPPAQYVNGEIFFQTKNKERIDLLQLDEEALRNIRGNEIGFIFQEPMTSLNPLMRCGLQVAESIRLHQKCTKDKAREKTIALFEEVKLPNPKEIFYRYPHELSGGQKQRVMIAMAISCNPTLLIADEPTTALDVTVQKTILELLKELQRKNGMAILFITHDLNLVKHFSDDVMVMYQGKCVEKQDTKSLFAYPQHPYTRGLLACRPDKNHRVKYLKTVAEIVATNPEENKLEENNWIADTAFATRIENINKSTPLFVLQDVQIWYPTNRSFIGKTNAWYTAVNGVNLNIHEGETMGLVGESGCGKTSIGKAIVKLTDITSGQIMYKGKSIADLNKADTQQYRRDVQLIFQDPYSSLNPRISIGEAIQEPMHVHGIHPAKNRKEKTIELLNKVGLSAEHYHRYPHEFSGGQRQRICIARALALQSTFLICDESVSALDVSVQAQVLNLLVALRDEFNLTYLFISHDIGVVKHISDHVAVMQKGLIVEMNDAENLFKHPSQLYTQELLQSQY